MRKYYYGLEMKSNNSILVASRHKNISDFMKEWIDEEWVVFECESTWNIHLMDDKIAFNRTVVRVNEIATVSFCGERNRSRKE